MDQIKIGKFIAECRKKQNLTQSQLAEMLGITDRAISKWENGRGMPDSSLMVDLCKILNITVNDLLNGEVICMENSNEKREELLLEVIKEKEEADKRLLKFEIFIGAISTILIIGSSLFLSLDMVELWLRIVVMIISWFMGIIGYAISIRIEQVAGYYECGKCSHKYKPSIKSSVLSMHMGRTKYMKCPNCNEKSWQKKVIKK